MVYPAHIKMDTGKTREVQTVEAHLRGCAEQAAVLAPRIIRNTAYLSSLIHDMGKYTEAFRDYITRAFEGEEVRRGSVNHTFAGVRFVLERWHSSGERPCDDLACELIAFAIGGHHGLFDCVDAFGGNGFAHRLKKEGISYNEAVRQLQSSCVTAAELDRLFGEAAKEITAALALCGQNVKSSEELSFLFAMLARLLLSVVIDCDRRDTVAFMHGTAENAPCMPRAAWAALLAKVEARLEKEFADSELNRVRRAISDTCRLAARRGSGVYRLNVPTGGGKTLTSLRYALAAAAEHGKKRAFFVIPLLSVLEQNAARIRAYIDDDSLILEHHSNIIVEKAYHDELNEQELLLKTWDAPIILTTLVQLLNTLFAGKTSCIRRMHALADSVIIIDEVQTVPGKMLALFNQAMNFLANVCGAVVVLCSATQPALHHMEHPIYYHANAELMPRNAELFKVFKRTEIIDHHKTVGYSAQELAQLAAQCLKQTNSLLLICNTKGQARQIYACIKDIPNTEAFHLSTSMCMKHRIETLGRINACLNEKRRIICVSTQLVEAGVDFSFGCVVRLIAGMDSIIQAAGRCNRNGGEGRISPVYIVNARGENLRWLKEIEQAQNATKNLLEQFKRERAAFDNDLTSAKAIEAYYKQLYDQMPKYARDCPIARHETTMYNLLSDNSAFTKGRDHGFILNQAFKTAGEAFSVFDEDTADVLVPFGEGGDIIAKLQGERAKHDFKHKKALLEDAKPYVISLYAGDLEKVKKAGGVYCMLNETVLVLQPAFYSKEIGFCADAGANEFMSC